MCIAEGADVSLFAQVRTEAYRDFLLNNPSLVKDKVRGTPLTALVVAHDEVMGGER